MAQSNYSNSFFATVGPAPAYPTTLPNGYTDGHLWVRVKIGCNPVHQWVGPIENTPNGLALSRMFAARKVAGLRSDREGRFYSSAWNAEIGQRYWQVIARQWKIIPVETITAASYREGLRRGDNRFGVQEQRQNRSAETDLSGSYGGYFPVDYPEHGIPSYITNAFFGFPVTQNQVDVYGYSTNNSYGYSPPYTNDLNWLPVVDSYPPFTTGKTILGPVIKQGVSVQWNTYNAIMGAFFPRPADIALNDTGVGHGRFLAGFRLRFNSIKRTVQTTEQLIGFTPPVLNSSGNQITEGYTNTGLSAPTIKRYEFKYTDDLTLRKIKAHIPSQVQGPSAKDWIFQFDELIGVPIDIVPSLNSGGEASASTFLDGSPLLTTDPNAGPTKDDHVRMVPYSIDTSYPKAPDPTGPFYYQHNDGFTGWSVLQKQTQGTYWIETEYAASTVYVIRDTAGGETYEYGEESLFDISMMVRRQEPPQPGIEKFVPSSASQLTDGFSFTTNGYLYFRNWYAVGTFVVSFPCDTPGHGFYIYEKWGGNNETQNFTFNQSGIGYYYPGYYHQVLAPNDPPAPQGWEQIKTTPGNTYYPKTWGSATDGELVEHQPGTGTTYKFLKSLGTVGGTFLLRAYAIILPFEWGGSVPYSMPPPFATTLDLMGTMSGDNLYGPSYWSSVAEIQDVSTAQTDGHWQLNTPVSTFSWPYNEGTGTVIAEGSGAALLPQHNDPSGKPYAYTAAVGLGIDAFYGEYTPPVFPPPPAKKLFGYANGKIDVFFADDGTDPDNLQGFYDASVSVIVNEARNKYHRAYWQDYGANIFTDIPGKGGSVQGTVSDPPGKIVLGYDAKEVKPTGITGVYVYIYSGPHFATGPIRMFVNADIDLTNGKGVRSAGNSTDAPVFPPFVALALDSSQGPGIGVLTVECSDGTSRNIQIYLAPPRVVR